MRFVYMDEQGRFALTKDTTRNIPPYAILSHTWSKNPADEVLYEDFQRGTVYEKGLTKLKFAMDKTDDLPFTWSTKDGGTTNVRYCWIDTCCISKTNEVELSHSIRSMYQWYRNAQACIVYLADVKVHEDSDLSDFSDSDWPHEKAMKRDKRLVKDFINSRWFSRGWTLQELLAPKRFVFFYSADGTRLGRIMRHREDTGEGRFFLGTKTLIVDLVCEATELPELAVTGADPDDFSVDTRFGWMAGRRTTREEDMAYALQGLFGVHMSILYGEGEEHARARLRREIRLRYEGEFRRAFFYTELEED